MGFLSRILNSGDHSISSDRTLAPTHADVITPDNPGDMSSIRSVPVLQTPRYFGEAETRAIRQLAEQRGIDVKNSQTAYECLQAIEAADTQLHLTHRKYQTHVAESELKRKQADVKYSQTLHGMRPLYADLQSGLQFSLEAMDQRVAEIAQRIRGKL